MAGARNQLPTQRLFDVADLWMIEEAAYGLTSGLKLGQLVAGQIFVWAR
jgi:hypothetical protein